MKNYLRGSIIIKKNTFVSKILKIEKGAISEIYENQIIKTYQKGSYIPLEYLNSISPCDFIAEELTNIKIIDSDEIYNQKKYYELLKKTIIFQKKHIDLLMIKDPIIKISKLIYYEYLAHETTCFYLPYTIQTITIKLKIKKREITNAISLLSHKNIITKQNNLIIIHDLNQLKYESFKNDY